MTHPSPANPDPFSLLDLPRRFDLEPSKIERAYLTRLAAAHPDRAGDQSAGESASLNSARQILLDPEQRARTLLRLLGSPEKDTSLPDGFLMEIMETRQEIEADLASGEPEKRARWESWAARERDRYTAEVARAFASLPDSPPGSALTEIRTTLNAWRYIERLIEQLDPHYDPARADLGP